VVALVLVVIATSMMKLMVRGALWLRVNTAIPKGGRRPMSCPAALFGLSVKAIFRLAPAQRAHDENPHDRSRCVVEIGPCQWQRRGEHQDPREKQEPEDGNDVQQSGERTEREWSRDMTQLSLLCQSHPEWNHYVTQKSQPSSYSHRRH